MDAKKILEQTIDDSVAEVILEAVEDYKKASDSEVASAKKKLQEQFERKQEKLFNIVDQKIEEREKQIAEEYSARLATKINEKDEYIALLEESVDSFKETLAERVNTFLANSKDEVRSLVEEEMRLDADNLKATHVLDEVKAILGINAPTVVEGDNDSAIARLTEDVEVLKERLEKKKQAEQELKAKLKVFELVESVPAADRDFFLDQMSEVETVNEAEKRFERVANVIKKHKAQKIRQELNESTSRGTTYEEEVDHSPRVPVSESRNDVRNRMRWLAGLKD